ncbi:MAG: hypothetical protein Q9227_006088 [Pyrenula ochraceoflavens]
MSKGVYENPIGTTVRAYYDSLESRIGYRLFLGGTRHLGYYESEKSWPWPITPALRAMEAKSLTALQLPRGSTVLDAGCGVGHVALYMARQGDLKVKGIDLTPHHITKALQNAKLAKLESQVSFQLGDYHDLKSFGDASVDGVYSMETLVHSPNQGAALSEFMRVLKPGGRIVMLEYDHIPLSQTPRDIADEAKMLNQIVGLPAFESSETDDWVRLAKANGFEDVQQVDMSKNVVPMLWLFYVCAYIPYLILKFLGLRKYFVNTASGVAWYRGRKYWRCVQVRGRKPG